MKYGIAITALLFTSPAPSHEGPFFIDVERVVSIVELEPGDRSPEGARHHIALDSSGHSFADSFLVNHFGNNGTVKGAGILIVVVLPGEGNAIATQHRSECGSRDMSYSVKLGKVSIELGVAIDGQRTLVVDGTSWGTVSTGDQAVISESRGVTINGRIRTASGFNEARSLCPVG